MNRSDPNLEINIRQLLNAGNKIGAIKYYRDATGSSLQDSKQAIERFESGHSMPQNQNQLNSRDQSTRPDRLSSDASSDRDKSLMNELRSLLSSGKKIEAVKCYMDATQCSLSEAKAAIDGMEQGVTPRGRVTTDDPTLESEIVSLLGRGDFSQAVQLVQARTNSSYSQSKARVDQVAQKFRLKGVAKTGCLGTLMVLSSVVAGSGVVLVMLIASIYFH